jgi:hypothetical protein
MHYPHNLIQKMQDIYFLEPNHLGSRRLTFLYKKISARFKVMPFIYVIPAAFAFTIGVYLVFGKLLIKLVTLLQHGL